LQLDFRPVKAVPPRLNVIIRRQIEDFFQRFFESGYELVEVTGENLPNAKTLRARLTNVARYHGYNVRVMTRLGKVYVLNLEARPVHKREL